MLGWKITKKGDYVLNLPVLSDEEESIILELEKRFRELTRIVEIENKIQMMELFEQVFGRICEEKSIGFVDEQKKYLLDVSYRHIYGYAFFDVLLQDNDIEEIAMIGLGKPIYVYVSNEGWKSVNAEIVDENYLIDLINKMSKGIGRRITLQQPRLDAILEDGSRIHASIPPISEGEITIRKFRIKPISPSEIIAYSTCDFYSMAVLSMFLQSDSSVLIAGNTASGKTTTLNAAFSFVPYNDRIVITEETPEINILQKHQIRLVANKEMKINLIDLVYDSLRMRPDRIIVGEIRNKEESEALLDVLLAGQAKGAYATFHAQSSAECLQRLKSFGINEMDLNSIDMIAIQRRISFYDRSQRKNMELRKITEISIVEDAKPLLVQKFLPEDRSFAAGNAGKLHSKLAGKFGISENEISRIIEERQIQMQSFPKDYREFFNAVQASWYGKKGELDDKA